MYFTCGNKFTSFILRFLLRKPGYLLETLGNVLREVCHTGKDGLGMSSLKVSVDQ